jgi:hypothetical protein
LYQEELTVYPLSGYSCVGTDYSDEDVIFSFTATASQQVTVDLDIVDNNDDFDLIVLAGACHPELCIDYSDGTGDEQVAFQAQAGWTYYFVVEKILWESFLAEFELTLSCN